MPQNTIAGCDQRHSRAGLDGLKTIISCNELVNKVERVMLRVVTDICETGLDPSRWSSALTGLKQALNADAVALAWHDFASELGGFDQMIAIPQNAATLYRVRFAVRNPGWRSRRHFAMSAPSSAAATWSETTPSPAVSSIATGYDRSIWCTRVHRARSARRLRDLPDGHPRRKEGPVQG